MVHNTNENIIIGEQMMMVILTPSYTIKYNTFEHPAKKKKILRQTQPEKICLVEKKNIRLMNSIKKIRIRDKFIYREKCFQGVYLGGPL